MRVICCYSSSVKPETEQSLSLYAPDTEYVQTKGLFAYPQAIRERWTGEDDLIVIEGDKEIYADTLPSFAACNKLWCTTKCVTLPAPYTRVTVNSLACAKFSAEVQRIVDPSAFDCPDPFWAPCRRCDSKGCWNQLDTRLAIAITPHANGMPHVHGMVGHHHDYNDAWWHEWGLDWDYMMDFNARLMEINSVDEIISMGKA